MWGGATGPELLAGHEGDRVAGLRDAAHDVRGSTLLVPRVDDERLLPSSSITHKSMITGGVVPVPPVVGDAARASWCLGHAVVLGRGAGLGDPDPDMDGVTGRAARWTWRVEEYMLPGSAASCCAREYGLPARLLLTRSPSHPDAAASALGW